MKTFHPFRLKKQKKFKYLFSVLPVSFSLILFIAFNSCSTTEASSNTVAQPQKTVVVSPVIPKDILDNDSAVNATLYDAAVFAWNEFIALNWTAQTGYRDSANSSIPFGTNGPAPLVWHTFRHKVEIYPGTGQPPGYDPTKPDYGYNGMFNPVYVYNPDSTQTTNGLILPLSGTPSKSTPWINLDETNEIGFANMFAGVVDSVNNNNMMLYMAKANKTEYIYATRNKWNSGKNGFKTAENNTKEYIKRNRNTPPAGTNDSLISFPVGTIEVKTAWRKLTNSEMQSGRFYTNTARYYIERNDSIFYEDETLGMVALHIIQKTPTAPFFIFATFEQTDNILTTAGNPVEDNVGRQIANIDSNALTPNFKVTNATPTDIMTFQPKTAHAIPGKSLFYENTDNSGGGNLLPQGKVRINRRINPIPNDIVAANLAAQAALKAYSPTKDLVWKYYKLVNVQFRPINKPTPGVDYSGSDSSTYYLANSVVESDYILQRFSGKFAAGGTISDFKDSTGAIAYNTYNHGNYLMGGCMGCHGNATNSGDDNSFILGVPVTQPDPKRRLTSAEAKRKIDRLINLY